MSQLDLCPIIQQKRFPSTTGKDWTLEVNALNAWTLLEAKGALKMRYYEQKYPDVDELVMVQVREIAEMGAYVKLVRLCLFDL